MRAHRLEVGDEGSSQGKDKGGGVVHMGPNNKQESRAGRVLGEHGAPAWLATGRRFGRFPGLKRFPL